MRIQSTLASQPEWSADTFGMDMNTLIERKTVNSLGYVWSDLAMVQNATFPDFQYESGRYSFVHIDCQ